MIRITFNKCHDKHFYDANAPPCKVVTKQLLLLLYGGFIMYEKYLLKLYLSALSQRLMIWMGARLNYKEYIIRTLINSSKTSASRCFMPWELV
jgi:hypothetical protein